MFSQFQFRLKINKIDLRNFKKNWLKKIQKNLPPPQKNPPAPKKISKNYFFSISISPKNNKFDFKFFWKIAPPPKKKSPAKKFSLKKLFFLNLNFFYCQPKS